MVRLHLDDQMDSKALMGAYVCTARPGEFVWQPGPLTQVGGRGRGGHVGHGGGLGMQPAGPSPVPSPLPATKRWLGSGRLASSLLYVSTTSFDGLLG